MKKKAKSTRVEKEISYLELRIKFNCPLSFEVAGAFFQGLVECKNISDTSIHARTFSSVLVVETISRLLFRLPCLLLLAVLFVFLAYSAN